MLKLYNTLTRKRQDFIPAKKSHVSLYTCGPTVYNYVHIGNLRSYLFEDTLKRTLYSNGYKVNHVMNITDVGHLTSDEDEGEDKMLAGARREKKSVWQIAELYTQAFKADLRKLNIVEPTIWCKATDHIPEQIAMIQDLEKNKCTYNAGGNVYFDTSTISDYGKLAKLDVHAHTKERVKRDTNKKNKHDFVLWFTKSKFDDQAMKWDSPWGVGYPGWHIECSAMATKYLGKQIDIHCGGIDHISVHHTNEIAQSEAALGTKNWVTYWMHNEFLVLEKNEKMAKSGDNFVTLATLEKKGFSPLDYRYFCLGTSYRNPLTFTYKALDGARTARKKLFAHMLEYQKAQHGDDQLAQRKKYADKFLAQINQDLNTPKALAVIWDVIKDKKLHDHDKHVLLLTFDKVLGFNLGNIKQTVVPVEITGLAEKRLAARKQKDWALSDTLRDQISGKGWSIGDTEDGYTIEKR